MSLLRPVVAAVIFQDTAGESVIRSASGNSGVSGVSELKILAAARAYPAPLRGLFELPGGKVEPDEDPRSALLREIREELGCRIALGAAVLSLDEDGGWPILNGRRMFVWLARAIDEPVLGADHLELRWVNEVEAGTLSWLEPNVPIVDAAFEMLRGAEPPSCGVL